MGHLTNTVKSTLVYAAQELALCDDKLALPRASLTLQRLIEVSQDLLVAYDKDTRSDVRHAWTVLAEAINLAEAAIATENTLSILRNAAIDALSYLTDNDTSMRGLHLANALDQAIVNATCSECEGVGNKPPDGEPCDDCHGSGLA